MLAAAAGTMKMKLSCVVQEAGILLSHLGISVRDFITCGLFCAAEELCFSMKNTLFIKGSNIS